MTQESNKRVCSRDIGPLEARMFVTVLRLGSKVPVRGLDRRLVTGLMKTSRRLTSEDLRHILWLDFKFVERTGAEINDGLRLRAEEMMQNRSTGGDSL